MKMKGIQKITIEKRKASRQVAVKLAPVIPQVARQAKATGGEIIDNIAM